jgi:hypothetical protein
VKQGISGAPKTNAKVNVMGISPFVGNTTSRSGQKPQKKVLYRDADGNVRVWHFKQVKELPRQRRKKADKNPKIATEKPGDFPSFFPSLIHKYF